MARPKSNEAPVGALTGLRFFDRSHFSRHRRKKGRVFFRVVTTGQFPSERIQEMRVGDTIGYDLALFRKQRPENRLDADGKLTVEDYDKMRVEYTLLEGDPHA
jgi:hypothetical protein